MAVGFGRSVEKEMGGEGFGRNRYAAAGRVRPHISRSKLVASDNAEFFGLGEKGRAAYRGWAGRRYVAAENLTYDFIVTFYDPHSQRLSVARLFEGRELAGSLGRGLESVLSGSPGVEARVIGLQSGEEHGFLGHVLGFLSERGVGLAEADLFGDETRNVAIDLKTGESYDILLEDRRYRPGELINRMTVEDFQRNLIRRRPRG